MRRKPYPITNLTGGLDVSIDAAFLTDNQSPNLSRCRFYKGILRKDYGTKDFLDDAPDSERPMLFDTYLQSDGDLYTMMATVDDLHYLNSGVWTALGSTPEFTGGSDDQFFSTTFDDLFIITNGKDQIQKWDGTTMADLGGLTGKTAKCLHPFYSVLVLGSTIESGVSYPFRIRWSDTGDPEQYATGNAGFVDLLDHPEPIVNLVPLGDRLFAFRQKSIYELLYTGVGGNAYFEPKLVPARMAGTSAPKTCVGLGDVILYFGRDSFYMFDGLYNQPISEPLFPMLHKAGEAIVNLSLVNRAVSTFSNQTQQYITVLPTIDNSNPELLLKYNIKTGVWTKELKEVSALGQYYATPQITWAAASGAWNAAAWAIPWKRSMTPQAMPSTLYGAPDGNIYEDDRTEYSSQLMVWESKDFIFGQSHRWLFCELWARGNAFDLSYSTDQGESWSEEVTYTPGSVTKFEKIRANCEVTASQIRFRIRTYNERFGLKVLVPWYIPRMRAKEYTYA